jgi:alcohol dehydrogenase (NADP+)
MSKTPAYAAADPKAALAPLTIERREPGPRDVVIDILYCGVCHSDIHQARDEWGGSIYPMVPGHEILGTVAAVGSAVKKWKKGDTVGIGCFVDSCRDCPSCRAGDEQYCENGASFTYNSREQDKSTPTYGGYSKRIVVDEGYVVRIPSGLALDAAAPLLCAGITMYSPLVHFGVKAGDNVGILGLGGLGHMGVKIAKAMGAHVTVLSHSPRKEEDARRLGADEFVVTEKDDRKGHLDFIIDTASATHDLDPYLARLRRDGTMVLVGIPDETPVSATPLIAKRRRLAGSMIGGIRETQEMLDFCARHHIVSEVEVIPIQQINEAYERTIRSDVRYRFVIDIASLA